MATENKVARTEPSRGAPVTAKQVFNFCAEPDNSPDLCIAAIEGYAASGHVVLLEALRRVSQKDPQSDSCCGPKAPEICELDCIGCVARAAIQQAERT